MQRISIDNLMNESGVAFGTSGARGLVSKMTDRVCYAYVQAFLRYAQIKEPGQNRLAVAGDLRPSTARILNAVCAAARDAGWSVEHCGRVPSPAVAYYGLVKQIPSIMVTGSHIPDDRNGIKFNLSTGEISKADEAGIRAQVAELEDGFSNQVVLPEAREFRDVGADCAQMYAERYERWFAPDTLQGLRIGLYQHSSVGRDLAERILGALGAQVTVLGRSEVFIPVDTEAIRPEDMQLARQWTRDGQFDALVSMDGDADRPLLADERGEWLRGDVLGILASRALGIEAIAIPVSCNSAAEKSGYFKQVLRTRIGSPFVIEGMETLAKQGVGLVAGYEANGGFLLQSDLTSGGKTLRALPTRDALLPLIAVLAEGRRRRVTVGALLAELPPRYTASERLKDFPTELGRARLADLVRDGNEALADRARRWFGDLCGDFASADLTDGVRLVFANGEIVHLRVSGNAPELRCYNEAGSAERVRELNRVCMQRLEAWRDAQVTV